MYSHVRFNRDVSLPEYEVVIVRYNLIPTYQWRAVCFDFE